MPAAEERKCERMRGPGYCWGPLHQCYTRVGQKWTKVGHYCEMCGAFTPIEEWKPTRPIDRTDEAPVVARS